MAKLGDYMAKKDKAKKAGFDTSVLKDDFQNKFTKLAGAEEKLATLEKECRSAASELLKTASAYKAVLMKFENANHRDPGKKAVVAAVGDLAKWLGSLEQEVIPKTR
jgi:hypothetical protein